MPAPSISIPKGGAALWAAEPKTKDTTYVVSFVLEGTVKIDIFNFEPVNKSTTQRPFWATPQVRRKFGAAGGGGELRRANSFRPSIEMPKGGAAFGAAEPKKKDMTCVNHR